MFPPGTGIKIFLGLKLEFCYELSVFDICDSFMLLLVSFCDWTSRLCCHVVYKTCEGELSKYIVLLFIQFLQLKLHLTILIENYLVLKANKQNETYEYQGFGSITSDIAHRTAFTHTHTHTQTLKCLLLPFC